LLGCGIAGFADDSGSCGHPLEAALRPRSELSIDSRPAGIEVVGTDAQSLRVSCTVDHTEHAQDIELRFTGGDDYGTLTVTGAPIEHGNVQVRIEVPRKTNLRIHAPAGEVKVEGVAGDKDIDLYAGQITISSTEAWNYRLVDASVLIGEVRASAYGIDKGGFFRSFTRKEAEGVYRVRAHLITGEIDLK
jgi:hypothetical protein